MTRSAFDEARDRRVVDDAIGRHFPCRVCGKLTLGDTLSQYGARCLECFEDYGRFGQRLRYVAPLTPAEKMAALERLRAIIAGSALNPRAWAHRLKAREESGEMLTPAQRSAWLDTLTAHRTLDAAQDGQPVQTRDITQALTVTGDIRRPDYEGAAL